MGLGNAELDRIKQVHLLPIVTIWGHLQYIPGTLPSSFQLILMTTPWGSLHKRKLWFTGLPVSLQLTFPRAASTQQIQNSNWVWTVSKAVTTADWLQDFSGPLRSCWALSLLITETFLHRASGCSKTVGQQSVAGTRCLPVRDQTYKLQQLEWPAVLFVLGWGCPRNMELSGFLTNIFKNYYSGTIHVTWTSSY